MNKQILLLSGAVSAIIAVLAALIVIPLKIGNGSISSRDHDRDTHETGHDARDVSSAMQDMMGTQNTSSLPIKSINNRTQFLTPTLNGSVKEFRLTAEPIRWEYANGKTVLAWGYNGQIPGPTIRATEGDMVRIIFTNKLPQATSLHWHGITVPFGQDGVPGVSQNAIAPGETYTYEFKLKDVGTRFYHTHGSGHGDEAKQFDMGLLGAFIIDPSPRANTKPSYDREYTLILDEWAIGGGGMNMAVIEGGGATDMVKGGHAAMNYNVFTVNGRMFPDTEPLLVKIGERVRVRMINGGTSTIHPMHLHGHDTRIVALDGIELAPSAQFDRYTITVHPGESYDIEFVANNPGVWVFHCHELHHAGGGMIVPVVYEGSSVITPPVPQEESPAMPMH